MTRDLHERKGATVSQVNRTSRSGGNAVTEIPHPNLVKTQEIWDLVRDDRAAEVLDSIADDIIIDNGSELDLGGTFRAKTPTWKWRSRSPLSSKARGTRTVGASTQMTPLRSRWFTKRARCQMETFLTTARSGPRGSAQRV
jgi:hypothetical protein